MRLTVLQIHRGTLVEDLGGGAGGGGGAADIFAKPWGESRLSGENCQGSPPFLYLIAFLSKSILKFALGEPIITLNLTTPPPPSSCAYVLIPFKTQNHYWNVYICNFYHNLYNRDFLQCQFTIYSEEGVDDGCN
jgi:hypothetical protein